MASKRTVSRLSPERRRAEILQAGRDVFIERGYYDTVMAEIAQRAGVVEGSIYRYFENKRALMFSIAENWFDEIIGVDKETLRGIVGTWNQIHFLVHKQISTLHSEPALTRLVFQHLRPEPEYRHSKLFETSRTYTNRIVQVVQKGMERGELDDSMSPTLIRDIVYGGIEHRTWSFLFGPADFDPVELTDEIMQVLKACLTPNQAQEQPSLDLESSIARLENIVESLKAQPE